MHFLPYYLFFRFICLHLNIYLCLSGNKVFSTFIFLLQNIISLQLFFSPKYFSLYLFPPKYFSLHVFPLKHIFPFISLY